MLGLGAIGGLDSLGGCFAVRESESWRELAFRDSEEQSSFEAVGAMLVIIYV